MTCHSQALCDRAKRLSKTHSLHTVAEILRIHHSAVYRMRDRGWRAGRKGNPRPVPTDWAIQAQSMSVNELAAHYHTAPRTVCRWFRERPVRQFWKRGGRSA